MANAAGFLKESIWRDPDFRALSRTAQATYAQLLSQKELDRAGILPLQPTKWVKGCDGMTLADLDVDLKDLSEHRFILVDEDTDELLIRSAMRHNGIVKQPNILKNAFKCARMVASDRLRHELAVELRRLGRNDAAEVADEIDPGDPRGEGPEPSPDTPDPEPLPNPSATLPEPFENPSGGVEPFANPSRTPGVGVGVGVTPDPAVKVGGSHAHVHAHTREAPPTRCPIHLGHPNPPACRSCAEARHAHEAWTTEQHHHRLTAERQAREQRAANERAAINACHLCDDRGYRNARVCDHDPHADARNAAGIAKVRAALKKQPDDPHTNTDSRRPSDTHSNKHPTSDTHPQRGAKV